MKLPFLYLALSVALIDAKNSYIVTVPKVIRPGSDANVCVNILKRRGIITVTATLLNQYENQTIATATRRVRPLTLTIVKIRVPQNIKVGYGYRIRVTGSGNISFKKTARNIRVTDKATSLFIQTDRPVYKPGDLVRFRTFGVFPNLKYVKDPMDIVIYDPKNNRIQQTLGVQPPYGVFGGELQLSTVTTHGNWKIEVKQLRETVSQSFEVKEYVLPKFEVNVIIPSMQLRTNEYFTFKVTAQYTFGKPVIGDVDVVLGYQGSSSNNIKKTFKINGSAKIAILMSEIVPRIGSWFPVFAEVTESITGNKANDSDRTQIYSYPEKLTFSNNQPNVFKPGLDYTYILRVTRQDDYPLPYPAGDVNITVYYNVYKKVSIKPTIEDEFQEERHFSPTCPQRPPTEQKLLFTKLVRIPKDGIIVDKILFPKDAVSARIQANFKKSYASQYLERAGSASNNFIQIRIKDDAKAQPGKPLEVIIKGTETAPLCYYKIFSKGTLIAQGELSPCVSVPNNAFPNQIFSKGSIIQQGRISPCANSGTPKTHNIRITNDMAPSAVLLLYYVRRDGEVVADSLSFAIEDIFKNKVDIRYNKQRALPAENVELEITADPNSLVSVAAVDKSVLLIKTGNDITVESVLNELQRYSTIFWGGFRSWDWWWPRPVYGKDAFGVFDNSGVYVLTDANLYQYVEQPQARLGGPMFKSDDRQGIPGPPGADSAMAASATSGSGGGLATPARTRTNFPETWIWANTTTSRGGTASIRAVAPDTITEWITTAFAMNPGSGLGVAENLANLTTFQRFFIRLELPYSAIRGEILILQATIFNYMSSSLEVFVKLNTSDSFVFSDNNGNPINPSGGGVTKRINVEENGISAVFFPIITTKVGKIKLQVTASSTVIADAVERELLIEAEGIKQRYNLPVLVDLRRQPVFIATLGIDFPPNVIPDSQFIQVTLIGDLMAQTLVGLENLLRMSYGCGEQNLLNFVPNVFVSNYLRETNKITTEIKLKIDNLLRLGYQRQLSYMRFDGSFSAFGNNDKVGSTWLTAFVVKSFSQAASLTYIDPNVMSRAITFLLNKQDKGTGEFQESGIVHHKAMQGGSASSKKSLTAFVLIALLEARQNGQVASQIQQRTNDAISNAIKYISSGGPSSINNLYELIIICYALTLANDPAANDILTVVEQKATIEEGKKYWTLPPTEANIISPWRGWQPPRTRSRALDVEMSAYVLLVYSIKRDALNGLQVLLWLGEQRNPNGGFISTQDTIVALQGLAGIAAQLYSSNFAITVDVSTPGWSKRFSVNNVNSLVLQSADVPDPNRVAVVRIEARGTGICLVQAAVYYNVPEELREPAFELTLTVLKDSIKGFRLRTCFRWLRPGESTMGYLEIQTPTGMEADISSLDTSQTAGNFKRIERAFRQVNLFFDRIISDKMCIEIDMNRVALVARHKPVPVRLSEYYEPSNEVIKLYSSPILSSSTVFEVCSQGVCEEVKR